MNHIKISCFGPLRDFFKEGILTIPKTNYQSPSDLKQEIVNSYQGSMDSKKHLQEILSSCAVSCDESILQDHDPIVNYDQIALLPPVCGG